MRRALFASAAAWICLAAPSALAQESAGPRPLPAFPEFLPPDLPAVVVTIDPPAAPEPTGVGAAIEIPPPDLPVATVVIAAPPPVVVELAPPDLPAVEVIVEAPKSDEPKAAALSTATLAEISQALKTRLEKDGAGLHPRLTRALRDDLSAFYAARQHAPLWIDAQGATPAARSALAQLQRAEDDGLDAPTIAAARLAAQDPAALAALDLDLSVAVVMYARDARGGRIDARRISNLIDPTLDLPNPAQALSAVVEAADAGAALHAFNPPHAGYKALRAKLRDLREGRERVASIAIPYGPVLRVGMSDARVALVRERLKIEPRSDITYDATVAEAVTGFQRERGLPANGTLTRQTTAALSGPAIPRLEADIIANMERWRWLPRDLGDQHIIVNIPEYQMRVVNDGVVTHQSRVIVGKPDTPTPVFSDSMQYLVVNPSWYVPPSILKKEFLPKLATDPTYAERRGYQVIRRGNQISVRQPPGERNALGNIKFMFPNRHAVYLHDTPTRRLFSSERRAFSHGCVRVDEPLKLAEIVLGKERGWSEGRVRSLIGRGEQSVRLEKHLPIHLVYFTAMFDEQGRLERRDDLYGHDRRVRAALGLDG